MKTDLYARTVERGWRSWLERLSLLGLEIARRDDPTPVVDAVDRMLSLEPVEIWSDRDSGDVFLLSGGRYLRIRR